MGEVIPSEKILLFENLYDALEFCEVKLLETLGSTKSSSMQRSLSGLKLYEEGFDDPEYYVDNGEKQTISSIFANILGYKDDEKSKLEKLDYPPFIKEQTYKKNDVVFEMNSKSDV